MKMGTEGLLVQISVFQYLCRFQYFFFHFQHAGCSVRNPPGSVGLFPVRSGGAGGAPAGRSWTTREGNAAPEKVLEVAMLGESRVTIPCLSFSLALNNTQMGSDL